MADIAFPSAAKALHHPSVAEASLGPRALRDFIGRWQVQRRIADARSGTASEMRGTVEFLPDGEGLFCEERGLLRIDGGQPFEASRRYYWRFGGPGRVKVLFDDGRPFHEFALGPRAEAGHDCAPDRYDVRYDFTRWPRWRAVWTVTGPRKEYVSTSDYTRA